ncbi:TIGR02444 family protein [Hyphobacterium sp. SN044]|uniref:TIGR02444 family protein n=1 Tax=Hyphobacterium sp. SN044 TaxID=2912575 RepID=UPI001F209D62|nr:TIGR02444 family protein [Hyphobacterium sp. SN044]MCF8879989.1 TIGR02444 family protein [Hyphobacterium sp. SN044]
MTESLKTFSLRIYDAEGVREALLDLQDTAGCDVTLVLWCCWLAAMGRMPGDDLQIALDWGRDWGDTVTRPLRAARRAIKPHAEADDDIAVLRQRVKTIELETEIITLERLETRAPGEAATGDFRGLAAANLTAYAAAAGLNASFKTLISRILPAVEK